MEAFEFFIPQNIMVGAGTMAKLPECAKKLGGSHAMLISGPTLRKMGIVDKAADYLKEAGMKVDIFTDLNIWMGIRKVIEQINANAAA